MKKSFLTIISLCLLCGCGKTVYSDAEFASPDIRWRPIPLWFWNNTTVTEEGISEQVQMMIEQDGYGGCAILPFGTGFRPEYLSEDYFNLYGKAIDAVSQYGGRMSLYDEYGFPSGSMGAINGDGTPRLKNRYPGQTLKRLDKEEYECVDGRENVICLNADGSGRLMAVTAVSKSSGKVLDLKSCVADGTLRWTPLKENAPWTVMAFFCRVDGDPNVDYLDPEAVKLFIQDTHGEYFKRFPDAFGTTVTSTFFDEPTMYRCEGRVWAEDFNEKFIEQYGCEPDSFYPALWYDLGEGTAAARCMMFGLRSKLYSDGFMKELADWSTEHGIISTGHQDQEEILNPTSESGDLLLCGKHMTMPGIDKIGGDRPAERLYKVVSSSAYNWDHDAVMSETYGAMGNISFDTMYRIAIDQYSKGITDLISHAVWYDDSNVSFLPELSGRNPLYKDGLPQFNAFLSRLRYMLARPGRHVADIAVIYPVQTEYAGHHLDGDLGWYLGGVQVDCTDYDRVAAALNDTLGRDFTYLHPETLSQKCSVSEDGSLKMSNAINAESFNTIILPGMKVVSKEHLCLLRSAAENGARVIFTSVVPSQSADPEVTDAEIADIASSILSDGLAYFVPVPDASSIDAALSKDNADVLFNGNGEPFNYIHKIVEDCDVFYFGNIDDAESCQSVSLLGKYSRGKLMDPHTGEVISLKTDYSDGRTVFPLELAPANSVFAVFPR